MDIKSLARKLQPLRPDEVRHWLRVLESADTKTKEFIEAHMREVAYETLGDFQRKILLSLPPEKQAGGAFNLGTVLYERPKWLLGLSSNELLQNLAIFGRSGAGKTNVVFHLIEQLTQRKIPWLFWDWKRTARHLLPRLKSNSKIYTPGRSLSPFVFNPFVVPPGMEENVYVTQLVDVMADAFTLGDGARSILQQAIASCYKRGLESPTVDELLKDVEAIPNKERVSGWKISATRALESLAFSKVAGVTRSQQEELAKALLESNTIIELDALADSTKKFLVPVLSLWLYSVRLASKEREKLRLVLVVEEAHHVLYRGENRSKESIMNRLLRQCREIGIGIVVVDQHPHLISSAALGNTYTSICMNLKDPTDINRARALSNIPDDEKDVFSRLRTGQGVVKLQDRWTRPVLIQFPHVDLAKGAISDDLLKCYLAGDLTKSELRRHATKKREELPIGTGNRLPSLDEFRLLHDVLQHPGHGVKERYSRLCWSGDRGNSTKGRLIERGWLQDEVIQLGKTRKLKLSIPTRAKELLGPGFSEISASHVEHEYWQRYYARVFEELGYAVTFEADRKGGTVDVLATKDGESVAMEIETGKSRIADNAARCLASKFDHILVIATNDHALQRVEQVLGKAGLLLPKRITLAFQDRFMWGDFKTIKESAWIS